QLGMVEVYPSVPEEGPGFAGAVAIIDSDTLLARLNRDPAERFDATALLTARLMDMFLGDWDRHGGQWRWARMRLNPPSPWLPIPRDRDKAFISQDGALISLVRAAHPELVEFKGSYGSVKGMTANSIEFDRRLLVGLERPVWDSVTQVLMRRLTDAVIENAARAMPKEFASAGEELADTLKRRRDELPIAADNFYRLIAKDPDIHGTDANDRATITRLADGRVEVRLQSGQGKPWFRRTFDASETREIRVYLHGGSDTAAVVGTVASSIPVRVIGGNGNNRLVDSSLVDGKSRRAHLYDVGVVEDIKYGKPDTNFNREPWIEEDGKLVPPGHSRGSKMSPVLGLRTNRELGFIPHVGVDLYKYGYGKRPYASLLGLDLEYSTGINDFRIGFSADKRFEATPLHFVAQARMSSLEVISYYGLGNNTAGRISETGPLSTFFDVRQRQWLLYPAAGLTLGPQTELSLGPVLQYSQTDSTPNRFISATTPYGFGSFGQAGVRLALRRDSRDDTSDPRKGMLLDFAASVFPAVWDVDQTFTTLRANSRSYVTIPMPVHPILVFRAGAAKVFGEYPFHEAAFIGGPGTLRSLDAQRYAGDASVYGSVELRVPFGNLNFVLPWNMGVFAVMDAGKVWVDGVSPGGWHSARGIGFWVGILGPTTAVRFCRRPGESGPC
ncbi:MAG TPA: BamA/TamA family outer membrane protein, partial [Gemmatimonadales bacterium]|nr:BamA/TamA family outer membrane protein [Gemmatimonadales bacterium]